MFKKASYEVLKGIIAAIILLAVYFTALILISGWVFAQSQFRQFWYYVVTLAIGFGIQVGLYSYLRSAVSQKVSPRVVATTGATSTAAMISCCAHYLVNILPILGITGIITFISQYQVELFWVGLAFNFAGIVYMTNRVYKFKKRT
ncbi:MAG: hypothetical protein HY429_04200 [Candidatus Levybacteria bacterium]|nr:hypothetical protein [Candidatus Levybacteria bacterium]